MQAITDTSSLRQAIRILQEEQGIKEQLLREQFKITYENLKPANLLKRAISEAISSPPVMENSLGSLIGLAAGFLSKRFVVGRSANIIRNLLGYLLQFGVTNVVAQHPDVIKSISQYLIQKIANLKQK